MEKVILQVSGMSCGHCVNAIEGSVGKLSGVHNVNVNLAKGTVAVEFEPSTVTLTAIKEEIDDQGYELA